MFEAGCVSVTEMETSGSACVKKLTSHNYFIRITHNYLALIVKFLEMLKLKKNRGVKIFANRSYYDILPDDNLHKTSLSTSAKVAYRSTVNQLITTSIYVSF